jgi:DNA-directed RNA polymerase specialized sigma24 family protein
MAAGPEDERSRRPHTGAQFPPTQWSLVLGAFAEGRQPDSATLNGLIGSYLGPIYACFRHQFRLTPHDADDLASEFAAKLPDILRAAVRRPPSPQARLRTFIRACAHNFALGWIRKSKAQKQGGGAVHVSYEEIAGWLAESGTGIAVPPEAEVSFDRAWADALFAQANAALAAEYRRAGKTSELEAYLPWLTADPPDGEYKRLAANLGITYDNSRKKLSRLRAAFGQCVQRAVLPTLSDPANMREELEHLQQVWREHGLG